MYLICLTLTALCFILIGWILHIRRSLNYWQRRGVPGPKTRFLTGIFPKSFHGKCSIIEELHEVYLQYKSSQKFVGVMGGFCPKIFVLHPALAAEILKSSFSNFHDNEASQWTSAKVEQLRVCSPFVSTGMNWKERRAELTPALTLSRLRAFYSTMRESAAKLIAYLGSHQSTDTLDAKELAHRFTADFMANFIWGVEAEAFSSATPGPIHKMGNAMVTQGTKCVRFFERTGFCSWLRKLHSVRFFPQQSDRFFTALTQSALTTRTDHHRVDRNDAIDYFLQLRSRKPAKDLQISGHTTTMLIDGFETAAVLIAHCLLLLSRNPRVQAKLRAEVLDHEVNQLTFETLNTLLYLDQCIQETLRIFPPLALFSKLCTNPTKLCTGEQDAIEVGKDDVVYISAYSFHHDAEFFENPEHFWPERFDARCGGVQKYREMGVFLPFGDGPRMCPGMKLGLLEAKMAVAEVVKHFQVNCSECTRKDNKISSDDFLTSLDGGVRLRFEKLIHTPMNFSVNYIVDTIDIAETSL